MRAWRPAEAEAEAGEGDAAHGPVAPDESLWRIADDGTLELLALAERMAATANAGVGAALFHATLVQALAEWVRRAAARTGLETVAMGGGCFVNAILSEGLRRELGAAGLTVLEARQAPANDGGIALGQAWAALQEIV